MLDRDWIEIKISRVIPAEKWKVIRFLTKIWKFPSYMPFIKEAQVLRKTRNRMRTRWRVEINKVPITWTEEDILAFDLNAIYFKAIEGDLEAFRGEWLFEEDLQGTRVSVNVYLKVTIPIIKDFAKDLVEKIVRRNFEAILEEMERHLISTKYIGYRRGDTDKVSGFGIIGHFYNFYHLEKALKTLNPAFKMPSREFIGSLFHITPSFKGQDIVGFKSRTGEITNGCLIVATFIPDMIEKDIWSVFSKVVRACKLAEKYGVGIVSLGGFTSIVAEKMEEAFLQQVDVAVTTGNTFTAAMAVEGVVKAAQLLDLELASCKVAVVGGTGDIGSGCARALATKVKQLIITGRTKAHLHRLREELKKKYKVQIIATTDNYSAVRDADVVIAAASAPSAILKIEWFKPGAIVCDVGYPKNISYTPTGREDILIFSGGLAKSPTPLNFPVDVGLPSPDTIYGCFAEGIILALDRRFENYSFGRGNITPEKMEEIRSLGIKHGFEVSDFWWGDRLIDEALIERIRKALRVRKI